MPSTFEVPHVGADPDANGDRRFPVFSLERSSRDGGQRGFDPMNAAGPDGQFPERDPVQRRGRAG